MTEFTKRYYPTICVRRAEMKAMEKLPDSEKSKMLPVVLLAPWLNSIEFDNTFKVIEKSIGNQPIIVDLDRYFVSSSALPSRAIFRKLLDSVTGPLCWMELIEAHENYIPCIQILDVSRDLIDLQIARSKELGRGFVVRVEINKYFNIDEMISLVSDNKNEEMLVILDYGYIEKSALDIIALTSSKISTIVDRLIAISTEMKIVISGSSFPNSFKDCDDFSESKTITSRSIFGSLSQKYGNYNFYYGDWASTKPRAYDGGGSKPLPRIDFPTATSWIIARSKENEWDFQEAAEMITRLPEWQQRPMVWGTGMIEKAAKGLPGGISTGPQAIASRVNIHLYLQNNFGNPIPPSGPQGKWVDPI